MKNESSTLPGLALSGSSGERFSGHRVRTYDGIKTLDHKIRSKLTSSDLFPSLEVQHCEMWAVVTTIHTPNESILGVGKLQNWCLIIIGDIATNDDDYKKLAQQNENIHYLSAKYQSEILLSKKDNHAYAFTDHIPFKSFARKNIGYMFAIAHGAKFLYDFDDDNILRTMENSDHTAVPFTWKGETLKTQTLTFMMTKEALNNTNNINKGPLSFNPYPFMGPSYERSWPRGFPINSLEDFFKSFSNSSESIFYGDLPYSAIGVIQSLCDGDPDVDAIFRMTRNVKGAPFTFDQSVTAKNLLIPFHQYSPYNAQATTHMQSVFWGLFLPITVPGRVTDIWRSYFTQRIMKDVGLHLVYTPPIVTHERTSHDYLADFSAESDLYLKTPRLLEHLEKWSSEKDHLADRILDLWISLYEHKYIEIQDVETIKEWLQLLIQLNYEFPQLNKRKELPLQQPTIDGNIFRAKPYFNVNGEGVAYNDYICESTNDCFTEWSRTLDWNKRPTHSVVKIILMTMDEWPLLRDWTMVRFVSLHVFYIDFS